MRLFDDSFDIFNDELQDATGTTETNYVSVEVSGSQGQHFTLEDILENDAEISVSLDIFETNDQADLDFNHKSLSDMSYFGSVYAIVASTVENITSNYPNGFAILHGTISPGTLGFDIDNTYLYGSGHAFPREDVLTEYTLYEISESTGLIVNEIAITGSTIGLTYGTLYLNSTPIGIGHDYIVGPKSSIVNPFLATLSQYERTLLEPPFDKDNFWPRDAVVNSILICEGSPYTTFVNNELNEAISSDNEETNFMWRKLYPHGQKMLDNDDGLMKRLILTYAANFDTIKKYQDHLAFAHTIDYSNYKHIPDDLVTLLANQWNWSLVKDLNQGDISEYIYPTFDNYVTGQTQQQLSGKDINFERWRRILVNIIFLYKKKGTRAGLKFFANIYGIPERLFFIDEIVDRVLLTNEKNPHHYVSSPSKIVVHTESGLKYVNAYTGEIKNYPYPDARNTTQLTVNISPFAAIEYEFFDWAWSDHPGVINVNGDIVNFQSIDEPAEEQWFDTLIQNLIPSDGTARYAKNYPLLENEGALYYANAATPWSLVTLQPYIDFLDDNWATIARNLVPAASKLLSWGTLYRNQFWNRQKYQWDPRELEQKELPIQKEVTLDHVKPVIALEIKVDDEFDTTSLTASECTKLDDDIIITQSEAVVNIKSDDAVNLFTEEAERIKEISDIFYLPPNPTVGLTYSMDSPIVEPVSGNNWIGSGVLDLMEYSNEMIIQTIDNSVTFELNVEKMSDAGYAEIQFKLYEKENDGFVLSDESYSILSVSHEHETYGSYKLSSTNNIVPNEFITIESSYVPYLNETVQVVSINQTTNEITTRPSIGLFHLPLGVNGSNINWLSYINSGMLNRMYVSYENANVSYQSMINLLKILAQRYENEINISDEEWDQIVHDEVSFRPIYGEQGGSIEVPVHGANTQNRLIVQVMLGNFDNEPIEFVYASILLLEFMKINPNYRLNENPYTLVGNMLQNHTRATFKRVVSFYDWANPVQEISINNDDYSVSGGTGDNIGQWGDIFPEIGTGSTVSQGDNIVSGTSTLQFGGLNDLNNRILNDKSEYFYTLKAITTTPSGITEDIGGINSYRDVNVLDSKINEQVFNNVSYYGRNFTFFTRANEPQIVDAPQDASTEFFAPGIMPANPTAYHSFDGVGDADRLELQLYQITGHTTYGHSDSNHIVQLETGIGSQSEGATAADRRLSWNNWLEAHAESNPWNEFSGSTITDEQATGSTGYRTGYYNTAGYYLFYEFMSYWENNTDGFWGLGDFSGSAENDAPTPGSFITGEATGATVDNVYWPFVPIDAPEIRYYSDITETMWRDNAVIKTIELKEYATDGYLYQSETILEPYQAYWWRILNFRNTNTLFGHNLEIFTSTIPRTLVTGPDGHGGGQEGDIPDDPAAPNPPRDELIFEA